MAQDAHIDKRVFCEHQIHIQVVVGTNPLFLAVSTNCFIGITAYSA